MEALIQTLERELADKKSRVADSETSGEKGSNHYYFGGYVAGLNFALTAVRQWSAHVK